MARCIILSTLNKKEANRIKTVLNQKAYTVNITGSVEFLGEILKKETADAAILDLDSIDMDNRTIRDLARTNPDVGFLCMSKNRVHPDLEDAICNYFYACLTKPIDFDELLYWLRCIGENRSDSAVSGRDK